EPVAGAHAQCLVSAAAHLRVVGDTGRRSATTRCAAAAEQGLEEAALWCRRAILRATTVLRQCADHGLALHVVVGAVTGPLQICHGAIDVGPHLLDLAAKGTALRRL